MSLKNWLQAAEAKRQVIVQGMVVPDPSRCVQCGVCTFHCPIGIDIRMHAWVGKPVKDSRCLTCGECVKRCPRGVLSFERSNLFSNQ
jgi:NAD-dependent dihydropyrimidine dehydrogenase PreA subunit